MKFELKIRNTAIGYLKYLYYDDSERTRDEGRNK